MRTVRNGSLLCLAIMAMLVSGCQNTVSVADKAAYVRLSASTTVAVGLVAVQDQDEAKKIAKLGKNIVDKNVLPGLEGDQAAVLAGLKRILTLDAFNDPDMAKFKAILSIALPLLTSTLPPDLLDQQLDQVPPDVLLYIKSFFLGVSDGAGAYLGSDKDLRCQVLRERLSKK
jgi:hypothetical protein